MNGNSRAGIAMDTVSRSTAEEEVDTVIALYRDDDAVLRYEELYERVDAEGAALPPEQWRDGYWDAAEYIVEASEVGIYHRLNVLASIVMRYTDDRTVWTYEQMRDEVYPAEIEGVDMAQFIGGELTFDDWIAESLNVGIYKKVDVVEYRDEDEDEVVAERLIVEG